jgi:hypothetical protein
MENKEPKPIHQRIIDLVGGVDKFREIAGFKRKNNKTMENEFVTYEQSLALKELGFDERTLYAFYKDSGILLAIGRGNTYDTPAPLRQQVLRWFRENHVLFLEIEVFIDDDDKLFFDFKIVDHPDKPGEYYATELYSTYEQAEDNGINQLIELVKEKDNGK